MTDKNTDEEILRSINIVVEYHTYKAFKKIVGAQNASKEIRAMIKARVLENQKNGKLPHDLKLSITRHSDRLNNQNEAMIHA